MCFLSCLFILRRSFFDLLYLLSADKSYSLDDESDKLGSDSRSSGIYCFCAFRCVFVILLVVLMFWGLTSLNQQESIPKVIFLFLTCRSQWWLTHRNVLALKFLVLFPNLKLCFIVIVIVRIRLAY